MKVGIDFDNTIACFDPLFYREALKMGLISQEVPANKEEVRNVLRVKGQEEAWTELQGQVYGKFIFEAPAFPGVKAFFLECRKQNIPVMIVSHKTRHPFRGPAYDLHQAAFRWLEDQSFFKDGAIAKSRVFFELTKADKMNRIATEGCTHFIDDLPEFLSEPQFPAQVSRFLFDPQKQHSSAGPIRSLHSWTDIQRVLLPS